MFGRKKEPKEKPKYSVYVGWGGSSSLYYVFEYRIRDNGVVEFRTEEGMVTLIPGVDCMIKGGKWNSSSE